MALQASISLVHPRPVFNPVASEIDTLFGQLDNKDDNGPGKYEDEAGNVDAAP